MSVSGGEGVCLHVYAKPDMAWIEHMQCAVGSVAGSVRSAVWPAV